MVDVDDQKDTYIDSDNDIDIVCRKHGSAGSQSFLYQYEEGDSQYRG